MNPISRVFDIGKGKIATLGGCWGNWIFSESATPLGGLRVLGSLFLELLVVIQLLYVASVTVLVSDELAEAC
jgi:hypothetical protein